jgi:Flp pilus assembly protein TadG
MRRLGTWLVVGALIALGAIAAADALRRQERVTAAGPGVPEQPAATIAELAEPAMSGALYYSDANEDCRLRGVTVPDLRNPAFDPSTGPPPKLRSCRFSMSADGQAALPGEVAWSLA